jgi:hypothetical protein
VNRKTETAEKEGMVITFKDELWMMRSRGNERFYRDLPQLWDYSFEFCFS